MDWSELLQYLPILIFVLLGFLGKTKASDAESEENPEQSERIRRIREEIARRRKQAMDKIRPADEEARRSHQDPNQPYAGVPRHLAEAEVEAEEAPPAIDDAWAQNVYEDEVYEEAPEPALSLESQLEEARAAAKSHKRSEHWDAPKAKPRRRRTVDGSLRSRLKDSRAAREAFLTKEILGPPLALRSGKSDAPWES